MAFRAVVAGEAAVTAAPASVAVARRGSNVSHRMSVGLWLLYERLLSAADQLHAAADDITPQHGTGTRHRFHANNAHGHDEITAGAVLSGRYVVRGEAGRGRLSRVVSADDLYLRRSVAIKLFHSAYSLLGRQEHTRLLLLNQADQRDLCHVVRLLDAFELEQHYCLVLELLMPLDARLSPALAAATATTATIASKTPLPTTTTTTTTTAVDTAAMVPPLSHELLREVAQQLLFALAFLRQHELLHADLKPENIMALLPSSEQPQHHGHARHSIYQLPVKLADFSNAMSTSETSCYYDQFEVQSLPYRAPEVLLGVAFDTSIDVWSLGCVLLELATGSALFTCSDASELVAQMTQLLGPLPIEPFRAGKFFSHHSTALQCTSERDPRENMALLLRTNQPDMIDFLLGLLEYDPKQRLTPEQALCHPFFDHPQCQPMRLLSQHRPYRSSWFQIRRAPQFYPDAPRSLRVAEPPATMTRKSKLEESPTASTRKLGPNTIVIRMPTKRALEACELASLTASGNHQRKRQARPATAVALFRANGTSSPSSSPSLSTKVNGQGGGRKQQAPTTTTSNTRKKSTAVGAQQQRRRTRKRFGSQDDDDDDDDDYDSDVLQL